MTTNKLHERVEKAIQRWSNELGISDYKFRVEYVSDRKLQGDYALVETDEDTREVDITINAHRLEHEPKEIEKTVIHELLHTRLNELLELMDDLINTHVSTPKTRRLLKRRVGKIEHKIVVALADALHEET